MTAFEIEQSRLEELERLTLMKGSHAAREAGMCSMELVAYIAGEPHSDHPACACPVLTSYVIGLNDAWDDEQRQKLKPYLVALVGTRDDAKRELRGWMAIDWIVREFTPTWLEAAKLDDEAAALRALPPIFTHEGLLVCMGALLAAKQRSAAAWDAAGAAAWDAAGAAARDAARAAAWDAAGAAAGDALDPTVKRLQASALVLLERMIDCGAE